MEERKRLNLGALPIGDIGEIIINQGIWTTLIKLRDNFSGLFLNHPDTNMVIIINEKHTYERRRFSLAHEYCHALVDRKNKAKITSRKNSDELIEKRANSFASEFLLPRQGVEEMLSRFSKGAKSRKSYFIYDVSNDSAFYGEKRSKASLLKISSRDIALIAHRFKTSYQSTAYKMNDLNYVSRKELEELIQKKKEGIDFLKVINLRDSKLTTDKINTLELNSLWEIGSLLIEAYRQKIINKEKFDSVCEKINIAGDELIKFTS
ncbi:MAG: ImmA/IrrE family metallo-endopeptidase [Cyanobacteria bacterium P01_G01_bin.39]